jgi:N-acetylhexosamine 1-kinase
MTQDLGFVASPKERAHAIASLFNIPKPIEISDFPERGNINQNTFLVFAGPERSEYLLQMLNPEVFTQPHTVMKGMIACLRTQQAALSAGVLGDAEWETMHLVPAGDGQDYLDIQGENGVECWRMMTRICNAFTYKSLLQIPDVKARLHIAEQAGRGLAFFGNLTADMDASAVEIPLPGYRNTELYYNQLRSALAECRAPQDAAPYLPSDPLLRKSTERHFLVHVDPAEYHRRRDAADLRPYIDLALAHQPFGLKLADKLKSGELKRVVVHGDTKLDNFLFSMQTRDVKSLVDLDTIMPHTWLSDWGDMVRSLVNIAGEKEQDLEQISVNPDILEALTRGFLKSTKNDRAHELQLMVDAPQVMALELGVRFLADYLRGDSYFALKPGDPSDLNKIRAKVQFKLFERMRECADCSRKIINCYVQV